MRMIKNGTVDLATETFGSDENPTMLLIMGATASMLGWPDAFCTALAERGVHVIRFDHRDTGKSTAVPLGEATYSVEDLAADALAVLDAYGVETADVTGMSLGGYIGQMLAVTRPERVRSLTLIASEPLGWDGAELPSISPVFLKHFEGLGTLDWSNRRDVADFLVASERLCAGSREPFDEHHARDRIDRVMSRSDTLPSMFNHGQYRPEMTGRANFGTSASRFWSFTVPKTRSFRSKTAAPWRTAYQTHPCTFWTAPVTSFHHAITPIWRT